MNELMEAVAALPTTAVPTPRDLATTMARVRARRRNREIAGLDMLFRADPDTADTVQAEQVARSRHRSTLADLAGKAQRAQHLAQGYAVQRDALLARAAATEHGSPTWMRLTRRASGLDEQVYEQQHRVRRLSDEIARAQEGAQA